MQGWPRWIWLFLQVAALVGRFCASPWLQPGLVYVIHPSDQEGTRTKSKSSLSDFHLQVVL